MLAHTMLNNVSYAYSGGGWRFKVGVGDVLPPGAVVGSAVLQLYDVRLVGVEHRLQDRRGYDRTGDAR